MTTVTQTIPAHEITPDPADRVINPDGLTEAVKLGHACRVCAAPHPCTPIGHVPGEDGGIVFVCETCPDPYTVADAFHDILPADLPNSGRFEPSLRSLVKTFGILVAMGPQFGMPNDHVEIVLCELAPAGPIVLSVSDRLTPALFEEYACLAITVWCTSHPDRFRGTDGAVIIPLGRPDPDVVALVVDLDASTDGGA